MMRILYSFFIIGCLLASATLLKANDSEVITVEISTITRGVVPSTAFTARDVREWWEAKITLRGGLATPIITKVREAVASKTPAGGEYGSVRWRIWIYRGSETISELYIDKLNAVFVYGDKPYRASAELIGLLTKIDEMLKD